MYDNSVSLGYNRLTQETANLAQNPLLHEVTQERCVVVHAANMSQASNARQQARAAFNGNA